MTASITDDILQAACNLWASGGVVAIPTETVYGLAADTTQPEAIRQIFALKDRPADHPLIVHIGNRDQLSLLARDIPHPLQQLADAFWPGPLTLIVPKSGQVPDVVTGGQATVGVRMPSHPITLGLLQAYGKPLAAPSANKYQRISPTTAAHVRGDFTKAEVPLIVDGGACSVGLESTIVGFADDKLLLLRPGHITPDELTAVTGCTVSLPHSVAATPRVPGSDRVHYAPRTAVFLLTDLTQPLPQGVSLSQCALLSWAGEINDAWNALAQQAHWHRGLPASPDAYGQQLYAALHTADHQHAQAILLQPPPQTTEWHTVWDRLMRLAQTSA